MRYYIADLHFFHENLNTKMDKRGFANVNAMNDYMLKQWNSKVRNRDEVVILGDLSWGKSEETNQLLQKLNGRLYLIQGNHDYYVKDPNFDSSRFEWIKMYEELSDNKRKVILCHYPIMCYNGQYKLNAEGNPKTYMLYGHVHDTQDQRLLERFQGITSETTFLNTQGETQHIPCNMINCFCMYSNYQPLTLDEWIACDKNRKQKSCQNVK